MKRHASSSPNNWIQAATWKKPVPDELGPGMVIRPRKRGSRRSYQEVGLGRPCLLASAVLKQMAPAHASMPIQWGGSSGSRKLGLISDKFGGAWGASRLSFLR